MPPDYRWRDARVERPWRSGEYLCACRYAEINRLLLQEVRFYSKHLGTFLGEGDGMTVAYWMPLPPVPEVNL